MRYRRSRCPSGSATARKAVIRVVACALLAVPLIAASGSLTKSLAGAEATSPGDEPIRPIPAVAGVDSGKVLLGERLFHDVRLSRGDVVACASCHLLAEGGADNRAEHRSEEIFHVGAPYPDCSLHPVKILSALHTIS